MKGLKDSSIFLSKLSHRTVLCAAWLNHVWEVNQILVVVWLMSHRFGNAGAAWRFTHAHTWVMCSPKKPLIPGAKHWQTAWGQLRSGWMNTRTCTTIATPMRDWWVCSDAILCDSTYAVSNTTKMIVWAGIVENLKSGCVLREHIFSSCAHKILCLIQGLISLMKTLCLPHACQTLDLLFPLRNYTQLVLSQCRVKPRQIKWLSVHAWQTLKVTGVRAFWCVITTFLCHLVPAGVTQLSLTGWDHC